MSVNNSTSLEFLENAAGEEEGLGNAGIETYKDSPYASIARECGQNSADARMKSPVEMKFELIEVSVDEFPAYQKLREAVDCCLAKAMGKNDTKETDFFKRASEVLRQKKLSVLQVSDVNTKGLIGPAEAGRPFHSLVKATGVSDNKSETSGGSFGIGKNAAFAASELQTVFYSTIYADPDKGSPRFLSQGKTILVSHKDRSGVDRRATGYWGKNGFQPVSEIDAVPAWLQRNEVGTSVSIVGFRVTKNWQRRIAASLIQNFFCAIHRNEIRFSIDNGAIVIDQSTMGSLFRRADIADACESNQKEELDFARNLYECLTSNEAIDKTLSIAGLGNVSLKLLIREKLPKRVCIVRNGMAITDNLAKFGDKFASFPLYKEFVAFVEPQSKEGSALFKSLENPRHDALSAERLADAAKREAASTSMKRLAREIREAIKGIALPKPDNETSLDELSEFFEDEQNMERPQQPAGDEDPEAYKFKYVPKRERRVFKTPPGSARSTGGGGGGTNGNGTRSGKGGKGDLPGNGEGGTDPKGGGEPMEIKDPRNVRLDLGSPWHRRVFFTPTESGHVSISVFALGLEAPVELSVISTDVGSTASGRIDADLIADQRVAMNVRFDREYFGPVEIFVKKRAEAQSTP